MSHSGEAASALISILTDHVAAQDKWEDYYLRVAESGENTAAREALLDGYTRPLLALCAREGFVYADILEIIPSAFKTRHEDRAVRLSDLKRHAFVTYGT